MKKFIILVLTIAIYKPQSAVSQKTFSIDTALLKKWIRSDSTFSTMYIGTNFIISGDDDIHFYGFKKFINKKDKSSGFRIKIDSIDFLVVFGEFRTIQLPYEDCGFETSLYDRKTKETNYLYEIIDTTAYYNQDPPIYKQTFFIPNYVIKNKTRFHLNVVNTMCGGSNGRDRSFNISITKPEPLIPVEIKSTPTNCIIYKMSQFNFDTDPIILKWKQDNFTLSPTIESYLNTNYLVVEGRTKANIEIDETNYIVFLINTKDHTLSPPLPLIPSKKKSNIINYTF